jgi:hypothetical protein
MREFLADPSRRVDPGKTTLRPAFQLSWEEKTSNGQ